MAEAYRYAAFISYSSRDSRFAKRLHRALEGYGIPASLGKFDVVGRGKKNRIYPVFRDREELSAGNLGDQIEANLRASASLIVICSPNGAASPWVEKEIEYFVGLGRAAKIFAIIPDTAPLVDKQGADATLSCFPPAFRGDALAGDKLEPLAADARKGKDGFRHAWLKIVAGMIGVSPGQIIDRDRIQRRQRALQTATVFLVPIVAVGLIWMNWSRIQPEIVRQTKYAPHMIQTTSTAPSVGSKFRECDSDADCPTMMVLPTGAFMMGSTDDDVGAESDEHPLHEVSIRQFAVSEHEITFDQWAACANAGGCQSYPSPGDAHFGRGRRPVINVSWDDAKEYVRWLSHMTGAQYRLLSEAEWEYAARGVTTANGPHTRFPWGDDDPACNFEAPNGADVGTCAPQRPVAVDSFHANAFGLYDMAGNAYEWVEDCYVDHYDAAHNDGSPVESDNCAYRVRRGGSWFNLDPKYFRSAYRGIDNPSYRNAPNGFRVARTL